MTVAPSSERQLNWNQIASLFHILSGRDVLAMDHMARYQDIRPTARWLSSDSQPLALLFISHRWETLDHPDPDGRQLRAVQALLRRVGVCLAAMMAPRAERLRLVPSLTAEGSLQAHEISRRMFGFGAFGDASPALAGKEARSVIVDAFRRVGGEPELFQAWVAQRVGVWLDYCCMPQRPLTAEEHPEFRDTLRNLDALVASSSVVALRASGDDYSIRGWCATEFFLGSKRSFPRSFFVDVDRLEHDSPVAIPRAPSVASSGDAAAAEVMNETYYLDLSAFQEAVEEWSRFEQPFVDASPRDVWSEYRSLQGSGFFDRDSDPNPFRLVMEAVRDIETSLIERWLMRGEAQVIDLGAEVWQRMERAGLKCSDRQDLVYLGLLLPCHGWIDCFRPLFKAALDRYLAHASRPREHAAEAAALRVRLKPVESDLRTLFFAVTPPTAATWNSRLSSHSGHSARERPVIEQLVARLQEHPPEFEFLEPETDAESHAGPG